MNDLTAAALLSPYSPVRAYLLKLIALVCLDAQTWNLLFLKQKVGTMYTGIAHFTVQL